MESEVELPECPVCLQAYDWTATVPRVLACGHSACEACLAALPIPRPNLPDAVRCPACTQLVPLPRSPGPSALPKNLDLLRFSLSSSSSPPTIPKSKPNPDPSPPVDFLPLPWTQSLLPAWKHSILPQDALSLLSLGAAMATDTSTATISSPLGRPWCSRENQRVSLFPISISPFSSSLPSTESSQWFRPSYTARALEALYQLGDGVRDELGLLVDASMRHQRGLCKVLGLWMGGEEEKSRLWLVCESFDRNLADALREGKRFGGGGGVDGRDLSYGFGMVGMELCEVVMGLHSQGVVCGCLVPSCFCFDDLGHCLLDINQVLLSGRGIRENVRAMASRKGCDGPNLVESTAFISPEVFVSLFGKDVANDSPFDTSVGWGSDVWSLACILVMILLGDANLAAELVESFSGILEEWSCKNFAEVYDVWKEKAVSKLEALLLDSKFEPLLQILTSCLSYQPESRPRVIDIWHCICSLFTKTCADDSAASDVLVAKENVLCCLALGSICSLLHKAADSILPSQGNDNIARDIPEEDMLGSNESNADHLQQGKNDSNLVKGLHGGGLRSITLQGHHDCVTGLAVGGGFLFSSSFDKTINVWSLQDFSHIQSLRGHEHRVMAILIVDDASQPICISGDSGSGIFIWSISTPLRKEPLKKWYEHNDWRYSGIHTLAVSATGFLYSGSGDKSIKAWSLQDYSLSCTLMGHKSTVSSLAVADGILYSGSWDGTIRLWWLHNNSPLSILGNETPENLAPVLSLFIGNNLLVSSYENGFLKMWRNDVLVRSEQIQNGAIFALHMDQKWLFTGGWDKIIYIKELSQNELEMDIKTIGSITCNSVVTSLLYWHGKLFVGFSNREIKMYYYES